MNTTPPAARAPGGMPASKGSNAVLVGVVGIVVGFLVGYGVGRVSTGTPLNPGQKGGYEAGYEAAKQKLAESGLFPARATETRTLSGSVVSVGKDSFVLKSALSSPNPLEEYDVPEERTVRVTDATRFIRRIDKTPEEFSREVESYQANARTDGERPLPPPEPYKEEEIGLKDLPVGATVTVTADEDIFSAATFEALEVRIGAASVSEPAPVPPPPGA